MELELLEEKDNSRLIKIIGEDHTLPRLLQAELYRDDNVTAASYTIDHPLTGNPEFFVQTKGKSPNRALVDAAERVLKNLEDTEKQIQKALRER
jgi:DNA-directed RNA polymerase subunit L